MSNRPTSYIALQVVVDNNPSPPVAVPLDGDWEHWLDIAVLQCKLDAYRRLLRLSSSVSSSAPAE